MARLAKERRTGPEGKPSSQKSPWRAVVGSRPGVEPHRQPGQYDTTDNFLTFFFILQVFIQYSKYISIVFIIFLHVLCRIYFCFFRAWSGGTSIQRCSASRRVRGIYIVV